MQMFVKECGPMGTGSNMFRSALRASDGTVYIGTYGPAPAIIWRYTKDERLEKVAEVEEYQLDCTGGSTKRENLYWHRVQRPCL